MVDVYEQYEYFTSSNSQKNYHKKSTHTKSNKSSKNGSLKGSTDYESKIKFKTEVFFCLWRHASTGEIKLHVLMEKM